MKVMFSHREKKLLVISIFRDGITIPSLLNNLALVPGKQETPCSSINIVLAN
jgi:hypothetical protein